MVMWIGPACGKPSATSTTPEARSRNSKAAIQKTKLIFATSARAWTAWFSAKPEKKALAFPRAPLKIEKLNQRLRPVLQRLLHLVQKLVSDGAVHDTVVVAQRDVAHRADRD